MKNDASGALPARQPPSAQPSRLTADTVASIEPLGVQATYNLTMAAPYHNYLLASGLVFANLVDFDTLYGHRNDAEGYAANLERFDARLAALLPRLQDDDILMITADHGNDPTTPSTDHSREYVPLIVTGARVRGVDLGTRGTFADLGQTVADLLGVGAFARGTSFRQQLW